LERETPDRKNIRLDQLLILATDLNDDGVECALSDIFKEFSLTPYEYKTTEKPQIRTSYADERTVK